MEEGGGGVVETAEAEERTQRWSAESDRALRAAGVKYGRGARGGM